MKSLILTFLILFYCSCERTMAQDSDSLQLDIFSLYENASDQEGMFYLPQVKRTGFISGSKIVNEKRLQVASKSENFKLTRCTNNGNWSLCSDKFSRFLKNIIHQSVDIAFYGEIGFLFL